ncbi:transglycosylase SLT domain-containing protein [Streptomyces sp. NPDC051445]|uniref:transglycosylase SLT domain-containing protein n=1 Tax=Streptomyces sp. NPDC051445 TaxID=3365653 RepID=UPI00378D6837
MSTSERGPIKVGTGYVEIVPKVLAKDMAELRTKITSELEKIGVTASKEMKSAVTKGLAGLPAEVAKQAKKAKEASEKEAVDSKKTLTRIAKELTKQYGKEAAERFKESQRYEAKKVKLVEQTSSATKKALAATVTAEEKAAKQTSQRWAAAEKERAKAAQQRVKDSKKARQQEETDAEKQAKALVKYNKAVALAYIENEKRKRKEAQATAAEELNWRRMLERAYAENARKQRIEAEKTAREEVKWRRTVAQAYSENEKRNQAAIRETLRVQRQAIREQVAEIKAMATQQRLAIQDQISGQQSAILGHRDAIRTLRRSIADASSAQTSMFRNTQTNLKNMGTWFHEVGTSITEAGNLLATKFIAPLAMAGSALTAIGVTNADKRLLGQLGLTSAGVSTKQSAKQMQAIQNYAINTPYSIDVMHEYQMRLIRSVAGSDKNWYSKDTGVRTNAANKAAGKTTDLIMAIGDSMARAGNLDPEQFRRAMYAMDMIMDMDRAPTRSLKQLAAASGMPASELAHLLGFENSQELWKVVGTPANKAKKGVKAGVSGTEIMNALLNYWNPSEYKGTQKGDGSIGFAEKMTSETISGRLQQMKERATFELGNMFIKEGKGGKYEYTGLGEKLMGKQVPLYKTDPKDGSQSIVGYRNEGGLINQVQEMAGKYAPDVETFLGKFLDAVSRFTTMIDQVIGWIKESGLDKIAAAVGNFLVQWGPLILAVGLATKLFGKVLKVGGALLGPARAVGRGAVSTYDAARNSRQAVRNVGDRREARSSARQSVLNAGGSRREARRAGREASRDVRTTQRGGDSRSTGRRVVDRVFGRGAADTSGDQRQIRQLEDQIAEAQREAARLRDELRDINRQTMQQIAGALAGHGNGSVSGAAAGAGQALQNARQEAGRLNNVSINQLDQELIKAKEKAEALTKGLKDAASEVKTLDGRKLGSLRAQQVETTTKRVGDLTKGTKDADKAVQALNGRSLSGLRGQFTDTTTKANGTTKAVKDVSSAVDKLKVKSLKALKDQFTNVHDAANTAYSIVGQGTGAGSLAGRIGLLNGRSLSTIKKAVDDLAKALKKARDEGDGLDGALDRIGSKSPGGGSSGSKGGKGGKKSARGGPVSEADVSRYGVLPGYSPWVDNIPAVLSPGESVLRPEVTSVLGEDRINTWNAMAVRGKISRHARGTSGGGGRFNLDNLKELIDLQNIAPIGTAMLDTMKLDSTSDPLGGSTQAGILGTGDVAANFGGSVAADKFKGMYDWFTGDIYTFAKKVPSFVGQIAGILGGSLSPVLGDYFWDDVWKGNGNIVDRGKKYMGDLFSWDTLGKVWENLFGGVKDSLGAVWDTVTNPYDSFTGAVGDIADVVSGSYNNLIGMVQTVKDISGSPLGYAGRVYDNFMEDAQAAMPNTKGLFDFDKGSKVSGNIPELANMIVEPGSGSGVQRWAPVAAQALSMLNLPSSVLPTVLHRIGVESGGNPGIVNNWDSNAKMGTPSVGLMQVIGPTYKRWAGPFAGTGPFKYGTSINPLANIYAGLNYATHRYPNTWQSVLAGNKGYATGTLSASPGLALVGEKGRELVAFGGGERVFDNTETEGMLNGKKYEIHVHEARSEPTPQAVLRALQTAEALYTNL